MQDSNNTSPCIQLKIRHFSLCSALSEILRTAGYSVEREQLGRPKPATLVIATDLDLDVETCARLTQAAMFVLVLLVHSSPTSRRAYEAAGATSIEVGASMDVIMRGIASACMRQQ